MCFSWRKRPSSLRRYVVCQFCEKPQRPTLPSSQVPMKALRKIGALYIHRGFHTVTDPHDIPKRPGPLGG